MENIQEIYSDQIDDPISPIRTDIDREKINELADSIKREGLINPITVRPKAGRFEVVAGHRRFMACKVAGMIKISCVVRELTNEQVCEIMMHENLYREDIDPVDEALFIGRLVEHLNLSVSEIAERMNRSQQWVCDRLEILDYPDYMVVLLKQGQLKLGVAKWLFQIDDNVYRKMYAESAVNHGMTVLQAEYLARQFKLGVLIPSEKIIPHDELAADKPPARPWAICARCGKIAEDPNLRNVFVHIECPLE